MQLPQSPFGRRVHLLVRIGVAIMLIGVLPVGASAATLQLACTPTKLGFGAVVVGESRVLLVKLTNNGQSRVTISKIAAGKSQFTVSKLSPPLILLAGQSFDLRVRFAPDAIGRKADTIEFFSNGSNAILHLHVAGDGASREPVTARPSIVSFGHVAIGTTSTLQVVLTNARSSELIVSELKATGSGFSVSVPSSPLTLGAGQNVTVNVSFTPESTGIIEGKLFVSGDRLTIPLIGTATAAGRLTADLGSLNFANVPVGSTRMQLLTVTNSGHSALTVSRATLTGSNFTLSGLALPLTLGAGQSATFSLAFVPRSAGSASGNLALASNASNAEMNFPLSGNTTPVAITVNPNSMTLVMRNSEQLTANVTGTSETAVAWTVSGAGCVSVACGTVSTSGLYVPPSTVPLPATVTVRATSVADPTKAASANVAIVGAVAVLLGINPTTVSVPAGGTQQFDASVTGTSNAAVSWTVSGTGCSGAACGTINGSGLYTAPRVVPSPGIVTVTATSVADSTKSATANVTIQSITGGTYYLAPAAGGGSDSNNGTSANTPWLTPNHSVNCGDVILAAPSTSYSYANFTVGNWGTVTCTGAPNVAWLKCITFDACKITASGGNPGIYVDSSYWGVQGWEVSMTANSFAGCFYAVPSYKTHVSVHHIVFANNVANGCYAGGLGTGISGKASADYVAIVGNIAYNAAAGTNCYSNINVYEPLNYDTLPGTHIYIAGNFTFGALNTPKCNGGYPASDGEGINIDTLDGSQSSVGPYTQQVVVDNNLVVDNGGRGIEVENNSMCSLCAPVYLRHNTMWGNSTDNTETGNPCAEQQFTKAYNVDASYNLAVPAVGTSCNGEKVYAYQVTNSPTTSDQLYNNWGYSSFGNNSNISTSTGFSFDPSNTFGTNPGFANAVAPGAPSCGSYANVPACMSTLIANFTPTNVAAQDYGYQVPSSSPTYDPLFPQWLCNVNLPSGLVTMGCLTGKQ